jgi:hypothetical protein
MQPRYNDDGCDLGGHTIGNDEAMVRVTRDVVLMQQVRVNGYRSGGS